jgi:hypothetical protein
MTVRATAAHTIPQRLPIRVVPGQQVQVGQHDTDWPAFVFITTDDGAGWVPERYLDTSADPQLLSCTVRSHERSAPARLQRANQAPSSEVVHVA